MCMVRDMSMCWCCTLTQIWSGQTQLSIDDAQHLIIEVARVKGYYRIERDSENTCNVSEYQMSRQDEFSAFIFSLGWFFFIGGSPPPLWYLIYWKWFSLLSQSQYETVTFHQCDVNLFHFVFKTGLSQKITSFGVWPVPAMEGRAVQSHL